MLAHTECALKKNCFQARAKILSVNVYILTHLHATRMIVKIFVLLGGFLGFFKNINFFGF